MASYVYSHAVYCHNGPRLGVYPLQQLEHYRAVKWRVCQLKRPESSYRTKARIDPAVNLPGPPPLPSRPSSAQSRMQSKQDFKTASKKDLAHGPQFIATTASMTIQARPPQKERLTPPVPRCPPHSTLTYPYPDPLKVKGDSSFEERLAEIAQNEVNTIKQEEWHKSKKQSSLTRPSSAKNMNPSKSTVSKISSTSRPASARGVPSSASTKLRKSSTPNLLSSHLSSAKVQRIHTASTAIHKSKSAMQLKQTEKQSKVAPSNKTNDFENLPPKVPRAFLPNTTEQESAIENDQKPLITVAKLCVDSLSDTDDSKADNLNVTSDLGLSLDSLHLISGEESDLPLDTKDSVSSEDISAKPPVSFEIPITPPRKHKRSKSKKSKT